MKEERRLLVQNVFPELKRECRLRNINLVYVGIIEIIKYY
jgi:hypothetical protein